MSGWVGGRTERPKLKMQYGYGRSAEDVVVAGVVVAVVAVVVVVVVANKRTGSENEVPSF